LFSGLLSTGFTALPASLPWLALLTAIRAAVWMGCCRILLTRLTAFAWLRRLVTLLRLVGSG